jgi:phosphatidylserine decarboxylase
MRIELGWGYLRRWYLKTFRRAYVRRMRTLRKQDPVDCPHEVIDSRDLKFYRNVTGDCWSAEDDPHTWRDKVPFVRAGLGELVIFSLVLLVLSTLGALLFWPSAIIAAVLAVFVFWFFRDPLRKIPDDRGVVVAPADGKVVSINNLSYEAYLDGPAIEIGIFLSIFNVHVNRCPLAAEVEQIRYSPGKFLNALRPASARDNERLTLQLKTTDSAARRVVVRQIAGAIARRIVCWARPGDRLARGTRFGMIKFGSRTELVLPHEADLKLSVQVGQNVKAGSTIVARYG